MLPVVGAMFEAVRGQKILMLRRDGAVPMIEASGRHLERKSNSVKRFCPFFS